MAKTTLCRAQDKFSGAFARAWESARDELAKGGIYIGACARNRDGILFRITAIEPRVYNHGEALASISCYGVRLRADATWGSHSHWVGFIDDLIVEVP